MNMAEVAARWPHKVNHEEFYVDALNSSKKLQLIVDSLLEMARYKNGNIQFEFNQIDLRNQITNVWLKHEQAAQAKRIAFDNMIAADLRITTSELALDMILTNLLSNAVEYSISGSHIIVQQHLQAETMTLCISNTAQNLEDDDLPHMTESLWRKDQSRSSEDHIGLGLTLVQAYCEILDLQMSMQMDGVQLQVSISGFKISRSTALNS